METAISLPNRLFRVAEKFAEKHGLSRNELFAAAISEFIEKRDKKKKQDITRKLNEICDNTDTSVNPQISVASRRILVDSEW